MSRWSASGSAWDRSFGAPEDSGARDPGPDFRPVLWVWASHDSGGWRWNGGEEECKSFPCPQPGRLGGLVLLPEHPDRAGMPPAYCAFQEWPFLSLQVRTDSIWSRQRAAKAAMIADGCDDTHPRRVALFAAAKAAAGAIRTLRGAMAELVYSRLRDCDNAYTWNISNPGDPDAARRIVRAERAAALAREEAERMSVAADVAVAAFEALL